MHVADTLELKAGESLRLGSLVSPNGVYALRHRADGTLVLCENTTAREVWQVGTPDSAPTRLTLLQEGYLVLVNPLTAARTWVSGGVDRRVVAARVRDDGRLVLMDIEGHMLWARDPLSAEDLAAYRPASGDRLLRGQALADSIVSPDGRYRLTHTPAGTTVLRTSGANGADRGVWSRDVGEPGASLALGPDGVLRAGADSMVLPRWTGRLRLDPAAFTISAVVVRDKGDVVLLDEDGRELFDSRTAAEETRLADLERTLAAEQAQYDARPERPVGSGLPRDWFDLLGLTDSFTLTLVERIDGREALLRLGAGAETIGPTTYEGLEATLHASDDLLLAALAVPVDDWIVLIEPNGIEGTHRVQVISEGTQALVLHQGYDGDLVLAWYQDGELLASYGQEDGSDLLERGAPAPEGTAPSAFAPFVEQTGVAVFQQDDDAFLPPALEIACLAAGIRPLSRHFEGEHLGAVFGTW
ncbi:DUF6461 domain-containing protein [Streptomyces anthocyanicus]|uniref:DUF6461 domain-containing protein n=1 Tax=Streptomyces anthocyanicus TaxID=68174 RepID=UPI002F91833D|nr:DUF6461 domain-containing protein [Streptomyces anthocyanicus]